MPRSITAPRQVRRMAAATCAALALALGAACSGGPDAPGTDSSPSPSQEPSVQLPLGSDDLVEDRETTEIQPGVTLTRIVRGSPDAAYGWTVEISIPAADVSPDPDAPPAVIKDEASADETVTELKDAGIDARAEEVEIDPVADYDESTIGWRVRVGSFESEAEAEDALAGIQDAGMDGSLFYLGYDPSADGGQDGPWRIDVLTIDPEEFDGTLAASFGTDIEERETPSELAELTGAIAAVNAGFFVLDPKAGAPGDPAGVLVVDGELLSEPVNGRPALVMRDDARDSELIRLGWAAEVTAGGQTLPVDGINRVPGLIRNCGGTEDDQPTSAPLHDVTCTDEDEIVVFTDVYGKHTPEGDGVELVLDAEGTVVATFDSRGAEVPEGGTVIQGTGDMAAAIQELADEGEQVKFESELIDDDGNTFEPDEHTSVLNGGPELVRDGKRHVTVAADGMVHEGDESFYYGWVHKRNPRTIAGIDAENRLVIATADGRSVDALGLSIPEAADLAIGLGLHTALNFDGGGSTAMVVDGELLTDPSDADGERPVGDAILVLPKK